MQKLMVPALVAASLTLASCGSAVPIDLPEDNFAAARTCFAAKGLVLREGKNKGDAVSYEEFVEAIKYPMIAAAGAEPFDINSVISILNGVDAIADDVASKDYAGAIANCDERFPSQPLSLPDADADAVVSCTAMTGFLAGAVEDESAAFGAEAEGTTALLTRLDTALQNNPALLAKLNGGQAEEMLAAALQSGFAQGDINGYVQKCAARFPAE